MKYIIWGCGVRGVWTKQQLEVVGKDVEVVAFADNSLGKIGRKVENIPVISIWRLKKEYVDCGVVIPSTYGEKAVREIVGQLLDIVEEENIYIVPCSIIQAGNSAAIESINEILVSFKEWTQIDYLGIKLVNHCNLNCIRCNNFSNISPEDGYLAKELEKDMERLHALIPNVLNVKLIGGEPLLNGEIEECIYAVKRYYPYSRYYIVTNGLLLKSLGKDVLNCFKENKVTVYMTLYPALQNSVDEIAAILLENEVPFNIYRSGEYFIPILNEEGGYNPEYIKNQPVDKCVSFYKGNICRCPAGLNIDVYNKKFHKSFPVSGITNIYQENLTGQELMEILEKPLELCRYCKECYALNEKDYGKKWELGEAKWDDWIS